MRQDTAILQLDPYINIDPNLDPYFDTIMFLFVLLFVDFMPNIRCFFANKILFCILFMYHLNLAKYHEKQLYNTMKIKTGSYDPDSDLCVVST
jgi:hypothetical protein